MNYRSDYTPGTEKMWNTVKTKPKPQKKVYMYTSDDNERTQVIGIYLPKYYMKSAGILFSRDGEINPKDGLDYWKEGWYRYSDNRLILDKNVTHWAHFLQPPITDPMM